MQCCPYTDKVQAAMYTKTLYFAVHNDEISYFHVLTLYLLCTLWKVLLQCFQCHRKYNHTACQFLGIQELFLYYRVIFDKARHNWCYKYSNSGKTFVWWLFRVDSIPSNRLSWSTHKDTHFGLVGPPILRNIFSHILSRPKKPIPTLP